jgi:hypothetical protein
MAAPLIRLFIFPVICIITVAQFNLSFAQGAPPVGTELDIEYAQKLWSSLETEKIVGSSALKAEPFFGGAKPHGMILELVYRTVEVEGHRGFVVVKKNYDGAGVSVDRVEADREKFLTSMTVMFRREAGYDNDNQNWFWVKYHPDGRVFQKTANGSTTALAGRLVKGKTPEDNSGCIYCHASAGGGDYVFYPDISVPKLEN